MKRLLARLGGPRALLIGSVVTLVGGVVLPWHEMLLTIGAAMFVLFLVAAGSPTRTGIDEVHGSAQWPNIEEVKGWMVKNQAGKSAGAVVEMGEARSGTGEAVPLSWKTDKHVLIIASSGSGKGTDLIIPNLLSYDGSVFVLDPKGENARATMRYRASIKHPGKGLASVHCLDPWGLTGKGEKNGFDPQLVRSRFNPLGRLCLDENAADVATESAALASALVLPASGDGNRYFPDSARQLIEGLIAYVVTDPERRKLADLLMVRNILTTRLRPTLRRMKVTKFGPDTIRSNASRMLLIGDNKEFGAIVSTAMTETSFLDNPLLQDSLAAIPENQLGFSGWRGEAPMSVYVCLPAPYFQTFNRWLRLIVTAALDEMMRHQKPPAQPVMFMLDELATLGRLDQVENAIGLARGYGIQMWSIFQDMGQIKGTYGDRWSSFVGNAGLRMFFGTQDYETGQLVSDMIGNETVQIRRGSGNEGGAIQHHGRRLLMPDEVMRMRQESMVAFIPGERPVMVRRVPYYENPQYKERWDDPRL